MPLPAKAQRFLHQATAQPAPSKLQGDCDPTDPDGHLDQTKIAGQFAVRPQEQVPSLSVEAVKIGIRRALLDDEDALAEAQDLVEHVCRELLEALPFRCDFWHGGQVIRHARDRGNPGAQGLGDRPEVMPQGRFWTLAFEG